MRVLDVPISFRTRSPDLANDEIGAVSLDPRVASTVPLNSILYECSARRPLLSS